MLRKEEEDERGGGSQGSRYAGWESQKRGGISVRLEGGLNLCWALRFLKGGKKRKRLEKPLCERQGGGRGLQSLLGEQKFLFFGEREKRGLRRLKPSIVKRGGGTHRTLKIGRERGPREDQFS